MTFVVTVCILPIYILKQLLNRKYIMIGNIIKASTIKQFIIKSLNDGHWYAYLPIKNSTNKYRKNVYFRADGTFGFDNALQERRNGLLHDGYFKSKDQLITALEKHFESMRECCIA